MLRQLLKFLHGNSFFEWCPSIAPDPVIITALCPRADLSWDRQPQTGNIVGYCPPSYDVLVHAVKKVLAKVPQKLAVWIDSAWHLLDPQLLSARYVCAKSLQSCQTLGSPLNHTARQAPLSVGFSRQEYWSGLPCPSPVDLPDPGIEPASPALVGRFFTIMAKIFHFLQS